MAKNESVDFFLRFLQERFQAFRTKLTDFLKTLSLENRDHKVRLANEVLASLDDLKRAMAANDHPDWVNPLESKLRWYIRHHQAQDDCGLTVLSTVMELYPRIAAQEWRFGDASPSAGIDFNSIYQEYYRTSRVPDLFDELVGQLEQIINSGEIDSNKTIKALEKLIATIRKNARGDYFATRGAYEFTQVFFKNFTLEVLESVPGIKHVVKSVRKTMSELDLEMLQVHDNVKQRLSALIPEDLPMLEYKPLALPAPKVIDGETTDRVTP